jgi:hypothetical protein
MHYLIYLVQNHPYVSGFVACTLVTVITSSLPSPVPTDGKWYVFFFNFMHGITGVLGRIPQYRSFLGLQEKPTTEAGIEAQAEAKKIDPTVGGITKKETP